jgi:hypothetical protein
VGRELHEHDHQPIRATSTEIAVVSIIGPPSEFLKRRAIPNHRVAAQVEIWCGDASATAVCAYSVYSHQPFFFKTVLTDSEVTQSSGFRELMTVKHALAFLAGTRTEMHQQKTIYWMTDSENLVTFLTKGSMKSHIQVEVLGVLKQAKLLNLSIVPIHLRREDPRIQVADAGSKSADSDNWSLSSCDFEELARRHGPFTVDLFADRGNAKVGKFFSEFFSPESAGVDALAQDWSGEHCWACPPVKLILKVIRKISRHPCSGLLIVPDWRTAKFRPFIQDATGKVLPPFKSVHRLQPFIIQNDNAKSALRGRTKFDMLALVF